MTPIKLSRETHPDNRILFKARSIAEKVSHRATLEDLKLAALGISLRPGLLNVAPRLRFALANNMIDKYDIYH